MSEDQFTLFVCNSQHEIAYLKEIFNSDRVKIKSFGEPLVGERFSTIIICKPKPTGSEIRDEVIQRYIVESVSCRLKQGGVMIHL